MTMPPPSKKNAARSAAVLLLLTAGSRMASAVTLDEYRRLIVDCRRTVEQKKVSEADLQNLRSRLSAIETVTYPGGSAVKVNTRPIVTALQRAPGDSSVKERLVILEALLTSAGAAPAKGNPQAQARQILAEKEFAALLKPVPPVKSAIPNWWVRFSKWAKEKAERFTDWLSGLLRDRQSKTEPNLSGVAAVVKFLQFLLYFVLGVGTLVALYLLARTAAARGWLDRFRKRRRRSGDSDLGLDLSGDDIPDPLGAARALAERGAFRDAVRMAYIASLRRLQENGLLVLEPNKTNWEYQRDLRRRSRTAANTLLPATRLFDEVWYGRRTGTDSDFTEAVRIYDALGQIPEDSIIEPEETAGLTARDSQP